MRSITGKGLLLLLMLMCMAAGIPASNASQTIVSYTRVTGDIFPALTDIDVSVTAVGSVKFTCSDGTVLPSNSTEYSISAVADSATLSVNYDIDRPLIHKSGSRSKSLTHPEWLLGDSPPISINIPDTPITITVIIHGHLTGHVTVFGNGSATPLDITWSTWKTINLTVSATASAQNGQILEIETATEYVVYFTVKVEIGLIDLFERNSPSKGVSGTPIIQSSIEVIPDFPSFVWLLVFLLTTMVGVLINRKRYRFSRD